MMLIWLIQLLGFQTTLDLLSYSIWLLMPQALMIVKCWNISHQSHIWHYIYHIYHFDHKVHENIQMRDLAITNLKYWFRISSILEKTKNSTKTSNTSFERSESGLPKSWRLGAWHSYWPATPTLYDKLNFLGKEGMANWWCCHVPVLQDFLPQSGLSNEILYVFVPFSLFL